MQQREVAKYRVTVEGKDALGYRVRLRENVTTTNAQKAIAAVEKDAQDRLDAVVITKSQARRI